MERRRGVSGIVISLEKWETGSAKRWGAVHGPWLVFCQHPLRGNLVLAPISHFGLG